MIEHSVLHVLSVNENKGNLRFLSFLRKSVETGANALKI